MGNFLQHAAAAVPLLCAAALIAGAEEPATLAAVECVRVACEQSGRAGAPVLRITGKAPERAGAPLVLAVIDGNKKVVLGSAVTVGSDGAFRAAIAASELPAGGYRFGLLTREEKPAAIAAGRFRVERGATAAPAAQTAAAGPAAFFCRTFGLAIPGVAYTFDNYATNTRTLTISSGAVTKSAVRVNPDGTYVWNSAWDEKIIQGRWKPDGAGIVLLKAQSGKDWRMERLARPAGAAQVTLWDQDAIWYHGTPLETSR